MVEVVVVVRRAAGLESSNSRSAPIDSEEEELWGLEVPWALPVLRRLRDAAGTAVDTTQSEGKAAGEFCRGGGGARRLRGEALVSQQP